LIKALDADRRSKAILGYPCRRISCSGPGQDGRTIQP
jgi:hypothetical protein